MTSITTSILYDNSPFSVFGEINYIYFKNTNLEKKLENTFNSTLLVTFW